MRYPTLALSVALATAACTSGPSPEDIATTQNGFAKCAADALASAKVTDIKAELVNIAAEVKPANADFTVSAVLPASKEEIEWKGNKISADVSASIYFKSLADKSSVSVSGYKNALAAKGPNQMFSQELKPAGGEQRGVNVSVVYLQLQDCANKARKPLMPA